MTARRTDARDWGEEFYRLEKARYDAITKNHMKELAAAQFALNRLMKEYERWKEKQDAATN